MADAADLWESELGAFDIEVDDSAAAARRERIEASRRAAKGYTAKVEEPGWFNDPDQVARSKGPARPALFALHQQYYLRRFGDVVHGGLDLLREGVKEETEVMDLVMRAALRCGQEKREDVLGLARQWTEFPNLPSLSLVSARILLSNSSLAPPVSPAAPTLPDAAPPSVQPNEVLSASLSSLRIHPSLPSPRSFLSRILLSSHPLLSQAITDPSLLDTRRTEVEKELERVEVGEKEKEVLRRVVVRAEKGAREEEEEEGVGRNVRSL
ncbi:hypothetical protein NBRC10512_007422 [Rhodotorula toruloides]|uniref:RHTO0S12e03466g1_1 n=2 Tax=Rhodotorula toruloides TaxID=5286 RepID=A0A061BEM2_RHOTO|nr:uncharacterized protein RHTO_07528 [Rhodotorula toruloides NP11]EMS23186.1 hypothetical protein RHTO_07528 [Rhodotorula toruloides NP11]CDR46346.1 RHTO0S12e03466g1_1 [Rhodotorula toruloides]